MAYSDNTYFRLRKSLDAFEHLTLNYCLSAKDDEEAQKRLKKFLQIMIETRQKIYMLQGHSETQAQAMAVGGECRPNEYQCDGDCLPYPCPWSK